MDLKSQMGRGTGEQTTGCPPQSWSKAGPQRAQQPVTDWGWARGPRWEQERRILAPMADEKEAVQVHRPTLFPRACGGHFPALSPPSQPASCGNTHFCCGHHGCRRGIPELHGELL